MNRVGFESTIVVFERLKTVHALDRAVTINIHLFNITSKYQQSKDVTFLFSSSKTAVKKIKLTNALLCLTHLLQIYSGTAT
jgi:hypothetical protein